MTNLVLTGTNSVRAASPCIFHTFPAGRRACCPMLPDCPYVYDSLVALTGVEPVNTGSSMLPRVATGSWRTGDRVVAPPANVMSVVPDITAGNGAESDEIFVCRGSVGLSQSEGGEGPYRRWVSGRVSDDLGVGRRSTYTASGRRYGRNPRPNRHPGHFPTRRFISPAIRGGPKRSQKARSKVDYRD